MMTIARLLRSRDVRWWLRHRVQSRLARRIRLFARHPVFRGVEAEAELMSLRHSLARGTPFGDTHSQTRTTAELGLESSRRLRGRPKRPAKQNVPLRLNALSIECLLGHSFRLWRFLFEEPNIALSSIADEAMCASGV